MHIEDKKNKVKNFIFHRSTPKVETKFTSL